ncbi:MAG: type II toxin-antitoxin system prevent-host-death family antitoxin [Pseudomonadota bacterium]
MTVVNMLEAKSNLSRLVDAVESGEESEIVIARNGKPAARLVPITRSPAGKRIGVAAGKFVAPKPDKALDKKIERLLSGEDE